MNTNFNCLWFDPTMNRTWVYRFISRRFIHSTTDRSSFKNCVCALILILLQIHFAISILLRNEKLNMKEADRGRMMLNSVRDRLAGFLIISSLTKCSNFFPLLCLRDLVVLTLNNILSCIHLFSASLHQ